MDFNPILHLGLARCASNFIGYFCFKGQNCSFSLALVALIRCNCICALSLQRNSTLNVIPTNFFLRWFYVTWQRWWICLWILNYYFSVSSSKWKYMILTLESFEKVPLNAFMLRLELKHDVHLELIINSLLINIKYCSQVKNEHNFNVHLRCEWSRPSSFRRQIGNLR